MNEIRTELVERALVVTLDRPEKKNALTVAMRDTLCELFADADRRDDVAVVVLTGVDPAFSAGVDVKELAARSPSGPRPTNPAAALRAMRTPSIVAVNGVCVTGALEIALSADIAIASDRARFADTHARLGLVPAWGMSALLPRAVGAARARELAITGRFIDADEALAIGLVSRVVPHDVLLTTALDVAGQIAAADDAAVRAVLDLLDRAGDLPFEQAIATERAVASTWRGREQPGSVE